MEYLTGVLEMVGENFVGVGIKGAIQLGNSDCGQISCIFISCFYVCYGIFG